MLGKQNGQRQLIPTGKLGMCESCGGQNGCYSDCPDYNCDGCGKGDAEYEMESGDDMGTMMAEAGVAPSAVYGLNQGRVAFNPGEMVRVPHALGRYLVRRNDERQRLAGVPQNGARTQPSISEDEEQFASSKHFSAGNDAAMSLMMDSAAE